MTIPAYVFDKTRQRSTLDRTSDISTDVDAVVIGTCSPALLFGLKTLVDTTPDLRFVGSANTLHDFIETCTRAGRCIALAVAYLFRAARVAGAAARGLRIAGTQRAVLDLVEVHECIASGAWPDVGRCCPMQARARRDSRGARLTGFA